MHRMEQLSKRGEGKRSEQLIFLDVLRLISSIGKSGCRKCGRVSVIIHYFIEVSVFGPLIHMQLLRSAEEFLESPNVVRIRIRIRISTSSSSAGMQPAYRAFWSLRPANPPRQLRLVLRAVEHQCAAYEEKTVMKRSLLELPHSLSSWPKSR